MNGAPFRAPFRVGDRIRHLKVIWAFSRPHTIIGTSLSVLGLYVMAQALESPARSLDSWQWADFAWAWLACIAANLYIVGLNQLTDVEIDRINKPDLPLASRQLGIGIGKLLVGAALAVALSVAWRQGPWLLFTVGLSAIIGTAYSARPLRLKRFHIWAAACIFVVRGVVVNLLLYLHFQSSFATEGSIPVAVWILTAFVIGFSMVIAWFKDIPDMQGDREFSIRTLSLRMGADRVFRLGLHLLALCYLAVAVAGVVLLRDQGGLWIAGTHVLLLVASRIRARGVDPTQSQAMTRYYLFVWALFFAEYLVFPVSILLGVL